LASKLGIVMYKIGYVYIMTNKNKTTLYIGVTNDLQRRIDVHKSHFNKSSFSDKYNLEYCVYFEEYPFFDLPIKREKELKKWSRFKKEQLINTVNPEWNVLNPVLNPKKPKPLKEQIDNLLNELRDKGEV
jgi:putative endonuclease